MFMAEITFQENSLWENNSLRGKIWKKVPTVLRALRAGCGTELPRINSVSVILGTPVVITQWDIRIRIRGVFRGGGKGGICFLRAMDL